MDAFRGQRLQRRPGIGAGRDVPRLEGEALAGEAAAGIVVGDRQPGAGQSLVSGGRVEVGQRRR